MLIRFGYTCSNYSTTHYELDGQNVVDYPYQSCLYNYWVLIPFTGKMKKGYLSQCQHYALKWYCSSNLLHAL